MYARIHNILRKYVPKKNIQPDPDMPGTPIYRVKTLSPSIPVNRCLTVVHKKQNSSSQLECSMFSLLNKLRVKFVAMYSFTKLELWHTKNQNTTYYLSLARIYK